MRNFFILATAFIALSASLCRGQTYHLTDLAQSIGTNSYAQGINDEGEIVGYWNNTNGEHAFLYQGGSVTDLGLLGVVGTNNYALRINNAGQVVGFSEGTNGAQAFIFQNGGAMSLGSQAALGSYAYGINGSGQVAGYLNTSNGARAFLYNNGVFFNIGTLGGTNSFAYGVNDAMQVAGSSLEQDNVTLHAFLWGNGTISDLNQLIPPTSGWDLNVARGINDFGNIAGSGVINSQEHGFLYLNGGTILDLGALLGTTNSYALDLNNSNQVVGAAIMGIGSHATLWQNGAISDLNDQIDATGWELEEACGINGLGQIVGWGISNLQVRAFLLTPIVSDQPPAAAVEKSAAVNFASPDVMAVLVTTNQKPIKTPGNDIFVIPDTGGTLTVTVTNPVANASFNGPTNIQINAITADSAGTVTQLQFYVGTKLLGTKTSSPNSLVWTNANPGQHELSAIAMDNAGLIATSSIVNISISTNLVPVADVYVRDGTYTNTNFGATNILECLTTSTNGNNRDVYFEFNLAGLGGISTAQIKAYGRLSAPGTVSNTVYSVTNTSWSQTNITWNNKPARVAALLTNSLSGTNWFAFDISSYVKTQQAAGQSLVSVGLHDLTNYAILTTFNSTGNTTNQPYLVVFATNNPLSIVITNPLSSALFAGPTNLTINASVFDSDGVVTQIQYLQGTNLVGSSTSAPYGIVWSNVASGVYSLTAIARDNGGILRTSSAVAITVDLPPSITVQPTNQTVIQGNNVTFAATVTGTSPLIYQWRFNTTNLITGGTNSSLTLTNAQSANAGNYVLYVTNAVGNTVSSNAVLVVLVPPTISLQPTNQTVNQGSNVTFVVAASGTTPLIYKWLFNGTNTISGGTNSSLIVSNVQVTSAGNYSVLITNTAGSVASSNALLVVLAPPTITLQPTNQTVALGSNVTLAVVATGSAPLSYRWYFGSTAVAGATNATIILANVQTNSSGNYYVIVTNGFGSVTSSVASLTVLLPTISFLNPSNNAVIVASVTNVTLTAVVSNVIAGNSQVQFFQEGGSLGIVTNAPYTLVWSNAVAGTYVLTAVATNIYGLAITSAVVNLTISPLFNSNTMLLWLKADAITGLTNNAGVVTWPDQSGQMNNATQTSSGYQPLWVSAGLNGLPVVQFNGSGSCFTLPNFLMGTTGAEAMVVLQAASSMPSQNQCLWRWGNNGNVGYPERNGQIVEGFGSSTAYNLGSVAQPLTQYHLYGVTGDNGYWGAWIDGQLQLEVPGNGYGIDGNSQLLLGTSDYYGNQSFAGNVAEILVFNRPLTGSERVAVDTYLNGKYGLLPAVPGVPTNLVATAISTNQISLTWTEAYTNGGGTQVMVERSTSSNGVFGVVGQVSDALSYVDTNLASGTRYYYELQAVNYGQWSAASLEALATTLTNGASMPLGNLLVWLKADAGLAQLGTNIFVNFWGDQSGHGNDAVQPSGGNPPIWLPGTLNGLPVLQFNGNASFTLPNFLLGTTGAEAMVVLQAASSTPSHNQCLWRWGYNASVGYPETSGQIVEGFGSSTAYNLGTSVTPLTQYNLYDVAGDSGYWGAWLNGQLQLEVPGNGYGIDGNSQLLLGTSDYYGNQNFAGNVAEILVFNRPLTGAERVAVDTYLNAKYGLLPAVPAVPTNLVATAISTNQISLTWSEPYTNGGGTQVIVERSTSSNGVFGMVGQVSDALSYVDTNLVAGTKYYYELQAVNYGQPSPVSAEASAITLTNGMSMPLGNLLVWLKADSGLSQLGTNTLVSFWGDQSGHANDGIQPTSGNQPLWVSGALNGMPALQFNGNVSFALPNFFMGTTGAEAMVVLQVATSMPSHNECLWRWGNNGNAAYPTTGGQIEEGFGSTTFYTFGAPTQPLTQYHLYDVAANDNYWAAWINGQLLSMQPTNSYDFDANSQLQLGTSDYYINQGFVGNVAEILVFNRPLAAEEQDAAAMYLMSKYNLYQTAGSTSPPSIPTNFVSVGLAPYQLNLQWNSTSNNISSYHLERELGTNGGFAEISSGNLSTFDTNFVDTTASPTNIYNYRVHAHNYFGDSYSISISPPTVALTNWPATILQGNANLIQAQAGDLYGSINNIQYVANNGIYASITVPPFAALWTPTTEGICVLSALATDSLGNSQYSASVTVTSYLDSNGDGIPDAFQVQAGNNPLNPWTPPTGDTSTNPPVITLVIPANATRTH